MTNLNFQNRTLFHGDNLDFLRGMNSETVDLIATDPPFNKNKDFHATPDFISPACPSGHPEQNLAWMRNGIEPDECPRCGNTPAIQA